MIAVCADKLFHSGYEPVVLCCYTCFAISCRDFLYGQWRTYSSTSFWNEKMSIKRSGHKCNLQPCNNHRVSSISELQGLVLISRLIIRGRLPLLRYKVRKLDSLKGALYTSVLINWKTQRRQVTVVRSTGACLWGFVHFPPSSATNAPSNCWLVPGLHNISSCGRTGSVSAAARSATINKQQQTTRNIHTLWTNESFESSKT